MYIYILEAAPHKTSVVHTPASHFTNHSSKMNKICRVNQLDDDIYIHTSAYIYIYIYIYIYTCGVMVIGLRNGPGDPKSSPGRGCLHFI